jgi:hypothetical protein
MTRAEARCVLLRGIESWRHGVIMVMVVVMLGCN